MSEDNFERVMNTIFYVVFALLGICSFIGAIIYLRFDLLVLSAGFSGLTICLFLENAKTKTKNQIGKVDSALGGNSSRIISPDGEKEY